MVDVLSFLVAAPRVCVSISGCKLSSPIKKPGQRSFSSPVVSVTSAPKRNYCSDDVCSSRNKTIINDQRFYTDLRKTPWTQNGLSNEKISRNALCTTIKGCPGMAGDEGMAKNRKRRFGGNKNIGSGPEKQFEVNGVVKDNTVVKIRTNEAGRDAVKSCAEASAAVVANWNCLATDRNGME